MNAMERANKSRAIGMAVGAVAVVVVLAWKYFVR
jgi:hypothetical protein